MKKVGVIGIGNMGKPMTQNLLKSGYHVTLYDVIESNIDPFLPLGAEKATSIGQLTDAVDVILLSLPNVKILEEVICGHEGILSSNINGKVIIDTTTSTLEASQRLSDIVTQHGGIMLDSPVTGGVAGAENATLTMMIGGDQEAFNQQSDILQCLGSNIVYVGKSGHGQVAKMVNQLLMGAIYCSVAEGFGFAAQLGVDIEKIYQAVEHGGAQSGLLSGMKSRILSGEYGGGHYLAQHGKDIDYVMEEANRYQSYMPVTSAVHEVWNLARLKGFSKLDSHSMFAVWEELLGKKLNESIDSIESDSKYEEEKI